MTCCQPNYFSGCTARKIIEPDNIISACGGSCWPLILVCIVLASPLNRSVARSFPRSLARCAPPSLARFIPCSLAFSPARLLHHSRAGGRPSTERDLMHMHHLLACLRWRLTSPSGPPSTRRGCVLPAPAAGMSRARCLQPDRTSAPLCRKRSRHEQ